MYVKSSMLKQIKILFLISLVPLFVACGGGTSSTAVDVSMLKIDGTWDPYFDNIRFLADENGDFIGQATWEETKLNDDGTIDEDAEGEMTFIFNSFGKLYLYIEILDPVELGDYDIDSQGIILTIDSLKTVYELVEAVDENCLKVSKIVDGEFESYYNFCKIFE